MGGGGGGWDLGFLFFSFAFGQPFLCWTLAMEGPDILLFLSSASTSH